MIPSSYIDQGRLPYPFCPGCSHGTVLDRLDEAMARLQLDPNKVVVVTDIGCVGLSDQWFVTHAFHGLHGRSVVYGEGIKLADSDLHIIILMGDGAAGIGGHHLISAARRNIGVHVILFNNFNFGMTGGEHSVTTPRAARTSTTGSGQTEQPFRIAETLAINGAPFTARRAAYDDDLTEIMTKALDFDGFTYIEVLEFCPSYYGSCNQFRKSDMEALLASNTFPRMLEVREGITEYSKAAAAQNLKSSEQKSLPKEKIEKIFDHGMAHKLELVVAGAAGGKIQSTTSLFARAAIASGLFALQTDDYPVTVRTGHSVSSLTLSPEPLALSGVAVPDVLFILAPEGLTKARGYLKGMKKTQTVIVAEGLPPMETEAVVAEARLSRLKNRIPAQYRALMTLYLFLKYGTLFPPEALLRAAVHYRGKDEGDKIGAMAQEMKEDLMVKL